MSNLAPKSGLRNNFIANSLGGGWNALVSLAFIPLYIKFLGMESYGLIGIFAVLQAWLYLLDLGMTPTLTREMARYTGGRMTTDDIYDTLRSIELVGTSISLVMFFGVYSASDWIASNWLVAENIEVQTIANSFVVMGGVASLRFLEGLYRGAIVGLQQQVLFNILNSLMATFRWGGAFIVVAYVSPTIQAFFLWQGFVSLITLLLFAFTTYSLLPQSSRRAKFSKAVLVRIVGFAGGMLGITILSLVLSQVDKIYLSKMLSLSAFGEYTLASVVAGTLYMLVGPIAQAWFPRLSELYERQDGQKLISTFHQGSQLITVILASVSFTIIVYANTIITLWTNDISLAGRITTLVQLLVFGNFLNTLMYIPYQTQLAHGWTNLSLKLNFWALLFILPAIFWAVPRFGAEGAALVWLVLNLGYVTIGIFFMFKKILVNEKNAWYVSDLLLPALAAALVVMGTKLFFPNPSGVIYQLAVLFFAATASILLSALVSNYLRRPLILIIAKSFAKLYGH